MTESDRCCICFEDYKADSKIAVIKCAHKFHQICIDEWTSTCYSKSEPLTCPTCRTELYDKKYTNPFWKPDSLQELKEAINAGYDLDQNVDRWFRNFVLYEYDFEIFEYVMNNVADMMRHISPKVFLRLVERCRSDYVGYLLEHGYKNKLAIRRAFIKATHSNLIYDFRTYARFRQYEIIKLLYDCDCITQYSKRRALIHAVRNNSVMLARFYVSKGISLNYVDKYTINHVKEHKHRAMTRYLKLNGKK